MKKIIILFTMALVFSCGSSKVDTKDDRRDIQNVLYTQEREWNDGDLEGFMQGYWNSPNLRFYGANGLTSGWNNVLENYKTRYPNKDFTGKLTFTIDNLTAISEDAYYVMGKYILERKAGDAKGAFLVIFKRIDGQWKIIADMSS